MKRKKPLLARAVVYLLAFLVPPVLVGVMGVKAAESTRYEAPPDAVMVQAGELPAPPRHDPGKPTAVVLLGNQGSEVTDVLAPCEALSESGAFNVYAFRHSPEGTSTAAKPVVKTRRYGLRCQMSAGPPSNGRPSVQHLGCLRVSEAPRFRKHGTRRDDSDWTRR